jgi:hypothetical protein
MDSRWSLVGSKHELSDPPQILSDPPLARLAVVRSTRVSFACECQPSEHSLLRVVGGVTDLHGKLTRALIVCTCNAVSAPAVP